MKLRLGFVTNSSSSSYICQMCGEDLIISDGDCPQDYGMNFCENGHWFCRDCSSGEFDIKTALLKYLKNTKVNSILGMDFLPQEEKDQDLQIVMRDISLLENDELSEDEIKDMYYEYDGKYEVGADPSICPICNFKKLTDEDFIWYVSMKYNVTRDSLLLEIKNKFKSYDEFRNFRG